ncbi:unnamed protein product [Prorocentrum cordatum]|uniref:Poly [ADP-ribose] polymerase n=1 Tax=Prorocentrum cordatum TaxID=2364126 RepID=A0ABN9X367_9DINO|nr:unnamed protein product [Polarella glacialis]
MGKNRKRNGNAAAGAPSPAVAWRPKGQQAMADDDPSVVEKAAAEFVKVVTSQVHRLREELDAVRQARARLQTEYDQLACQAAAGRDKLRDLSEHLMAIQAEKDELVVQLAGAVARGAQSSQISDQAGFSGVEWRFEGHPGEWTSLPADRSADLQKHYQNFLKGGDSIVRMRSGVEEYSFDFSTLSQTNIRTNKSRAIKGHLHAPSNWTRCVHLGNMFKVTELESVELSGFTLVSGANVDGTYVLSSFHTINGSPCWWRADGQSFIYAYEKNIAISPVSCEFPSIRANIVQGYRWARGCFLYRGAADPRRTTNGWLRCGEGGWKECSTAQIASHGLCSTPPLMEMAVEFTDTQTLRAFSQLFQDSAIHAAHIHGASICDKFKTNAKVVRVLRIENWHLWAKYQNHLQQVKGDLLKLGVVVEPVEPALPAALSNLPDQCGCMDVAVGEQMLFHGTDHETAAKIALGGFDFRLSKPGFYGQGAYFASQACKSHQYTGKCFGLHTIILSRVVLGDVFYATKVDRECKRPPPRAGTSRCCDTVVARPGPMPGHPHGEQIHQEFVIFDKFQAYPEFLVQYTCDDA